MRLKLFCVTVALLAAPAPLLAQDGAPIAAARDLYAAARYDEALVLLDRLKNDGPAAPARDVEQYRYLCLFALGRADEAGVVMEALVAADPFYQPPDEQASPRVRAAFRAARRRALPAAADRSYAEARTAFERKAYKEAVERFRSVLRLLDDPDMDGRAAEMRVLAQGFLDLSVAASTPPPAPPPPAPAPPPPLPTVYIGTEPGVKPPVPIFQELPKIPSTIAQLARRIGSLEVVIAENGTVEHAKMRASVNEKYDAMVIEAALAWTYRPATRNGTPVKFRKLIQITVR